MEVILEIVIEFFAMLFFDLVGWFIGSTKVPKPLRILFVSFLLLPLILLLAFWGFKNINSNTAITVTSFVISFGLLLAYLFLVKRILTGKPLKHIKKERI